MGLEVCRFTAGNENDLMLKTSTSYSQKTQADLFQYIPPCRGDVSTQSKWFVQNVLIHFSCVPTVKGWLQQHKDDTDVIMTPICVIKWNTQYTHTHI